MSSIPNSPIVAAEFISSSLSTYQVDEARAFSRRNKVPKTRATMAAKNPFTSPPKSPSRDKSCSCPHVLIADDDLFQHFYYQKLLETNNLTAQNGDFKFQLCFSGEELLEKCTQIGDCGCGKLKLVITDYYMGNDKLNGVETSTKTRSAGYTGTLLLRTSESAENLRLKHKNLDRLIEEKVIDEFVSKCDLRQSRERIVSCLEKK